MRNTPRGLSREELIEVSVRRLVREWGVSETEAREAIERCQSRERRLGREIALGWTVYPIPEPRRPIVIDLTAAEDRCDTG